MIKLPSEEKSKLLVCDLEEGDVALIEYHKKLVLVYTYRETSSRKISMIALNKKMLYWKSTEGMSLPLIKIFESGDTLEIA